MADHGPTVCGYTQRFNVMVQYLIQCQRPITTARAAISAFAHYKPIDLFQYARKLKLGHHAVYTVYFFIGVFQKKDFPFPGWQIITAYNTTKHGKVPTHQGSGGFSRGKCPYPVM